jgi:hypothetical protein
MHEDDRLHDGCYGVQSPSEDAEVERSLKGPSEGNSGRFKDDLTCQLLRDDLVKEARA